VRTELQVCIYSKLLTCKRQNIFFSIKIKRHKSIIFFLFSSKILVNVRFVHVLFVAHVFILIWANPKIPFEKTKSFYESGNRNNLLKVPHFLACIFHTKECFFSYGIFSNDNIFFSFVSFCACQTVVSCNFSS